MTSQKAFSYKILKRHAFGMPLLLLIYIREWLIQRYFHFFEELYKEETEHEAGGALDSICRDIHGGGSEAIEEAFEYKIAERHKDFRKKAADDLGRELAKARVKQLIDHEGNERHCALDHEGGGSVYHVAREYIRQGRADACGKNGLPGC